MNRYIVHFKFTVYDKVVVEAENIEDAEEKALEESGYNDEEIYDVEEL